MQPGGSRLNHSREIPPEAVCGGIFDRFFNFDNCQLEVVSDAISGWVDQDVGLDIRADFGNSKLKPSDASFSTLFRTSITSDWKI